MYLTIAMHEVDFSLYSLRGAFWHTTIHVFLMFCSEFPKHVSSINTWSLMLVATQENSFTILITVKSLLVFSINPHVGIEN